MSPKLETYIAEQQRLCDGATEGPWQNYYDRHLVQQTLEPYPEVDVVGDICRASAFEDGDFIASSRTTLPKLIKAVRLYAESIKDDDAATKNLIEILEI